MMDGRKPNFFIVGTAKAATTSLHEYLNAHPDVFMSPEKEPQYLAVQDGKFVSVDGYVNPAHTIRSYPPVIEAEDKYHALFDGATDEAVVGESSTLYLYSKLAPERIASNYPDAKIVMILRNPVDRAYSQFLHHVRDGHETTTDFRKAFFGEEERLDRGPFWHYRRMGCYHAQVEQYVDRLQTDQVHLVRFREIKEDVSCVLRNIYQFLGVDDSFEPGNFHVRNKTGLPERTWMNNLLFLARRFPLLRRVTHLIPEPIREGIRTLRDRNLAKPKLSTETRRDMASAFHEDIEKLEGLLGLNFSTWKESIDSTHA